MAEEKSMRLSQVAKILNKGLSSVAKSLSANGFKVETNPNTKISTEQLEVLAKEYKSTELLNGTRRAEPPVAVAEPPRRREEDFLPTYRRDDAGRPLTESKVEVPKPAPAVEPVKPEPQPVQTGLPGLKVVGKIDLNAKPVPQVKAPVVAAPEVPKPAPVEPPKPVVAPVAVAPVDVPVPKPVQPEPVQQPEVKTAPVAAPIEAPKPNPVEPVARVETLKTETPKATTPAPGAKSDNRPPRTEKPVQPKPTGQSTADKGSKPMDKPAQPTNETPAAPTETIRAAGSHQLGGLKILGKIELPTPNSRQGNNNNNRRQDGKRKRIRGQGPAGGSNQPGQGGQQSGQGNRTPSDRNQNATPRDGNRPVVPAQGSGTTGTNTTNTNNRTGGGGTNTNANRGGTSRGGGRGPARRETPTQADVNKSIQQTRDRMRGNTPNRGADRRRDRRSQREEDRRVMNEQEEMEAKILRVTEFVSANDLASLMDVSINEVISVCLSLGMFVSINQRLDAEAITVIADEFGYDVQFISAEDETEAGVDTEADDPADLVGRAPIVTIMGHVDHGKTSLLDYIRREKVAAGEAGGITQHIGAYSVKASKDRTIAFLDTPGHEAFTAMRARGAKVTDVVIIVIAADDSVMPQTREAINHAQVAGVPIVFAFSKIDKPGADTEKIRSELSSMNMLVEEWGGKYQTQEISSKSGAGIDDLLEKVLLEAEILELTANPDRRALGTVIEASLDKGRGYVSTVLVIMILLQHSYYHLMTLILTKSQAALLITSSIPKDAAFKSIDSGLLALLQERDNLINFTNSEPPEGLFNTQSDSDTPSDEKPYNDISTFNQNLLEGENILPSPSKSTLVSASLSVPCDAEANKQTADNNLQDTALLPWDRGNGKIPDLVPNLPSLSLPSLPDSFPNALKVFKNIMKGGNWSNGKFSSIFISSLLKFA